MRFVTLLLVLFSIAAVADSGWGGRYEDEDHERVYRARQQATILPLEAVLDKLNLDPGTKLLEVEHEREHGINIYEIQYLTNGGEIHEVEVDAATGRVLRRERE